jgi:FkbM family methyltransferase
MSTPAEPPRPVGRSERFRVPSLIERLGGAAASRLSDGALRRVLRTVYRGTLSLRTGGRGIRCTLPGGETVRLLPAYRYVTWHPDEYAAFRAALGLGDSAIDAGANVGAYALAFGRWVGERGRVHAFEPSPLAFDGLRRHISLNRLGATVIPHRHALSDRVGDLVLRDDGHHGTTRGWLSGDPPASRRTVPATTLDAFCAASAIRPKLIKIDVEGAELAVLRGARDVIRECGSTLALFAELHPAVWAESGQTREALLDELAAQRLRVKPLVHGTDPWTLEGVCVRLVRA